MQFLKMSEKRGITLQSSIPNRELIKAYGACQWWLSKIWLNQKKIKHPIQKLWQSSGWASDTELYLIGNTILKLRDQGTKREAFEGKKKEFLGKQSANYLGYLFELLVSNLFIEGGNKVNLLPPSAVGYDLDVITPKGTQIQVSCKVVQSSQKHKVFLQEVSKLKNSFVKATQSLRLNGSFLVAEINSIHSELPLKEDIKNCLRSSLIVPKYFMYGENAFLFGKNPLPSYAKGFSTNIPSYSFTAASKIDKKYELERIKSTVNKANKGFKELTVKDKVNLTVIRIPQYLSIESAKEYIENEFAKGVYRNTSAILFLQTHVVNNIKNKNQQEVLINTTLQFVINPSSVVVWPLSDTLHMVQPLGTVSTTTPPIQIIDQKIEQDMYIETDYIESIIVPLGTPMGGSNIAGVRRVVQWEGTDLAMEMFPIPTELQLL
ncbi:hypothetical protein V7114_11625 [Neobacillus niacini]|uniref:hypothetical protein n=1 Tax=Neobacillus niacini TaxID=86668 RepID=UPI002FFF3D87